MSPGKAMWLAVAFACGAGTAIPAGAVDKTDTAPPTLSQEDIDLWAFMAVSDLAPGKTVADFRAMPNFSGETRDELRGLKDDAEQTRGGPVGYRFAYSDGLDVRVLDYGESAFITRLRVSGAERTVKDTVKIGSSREQIESTLDRPTRAGGSYWVYEGKNDQIRVFYTPKGAVSAVEVDRGG